MLIAVSGSVIPSGYRIRTNLNHSERDHGPRECLPQSMIGSRRTDACTCTDERIHMFELAGDELKGMDVYAHVGSISTDHSIMMAKAALAAASAR